MHESSTRLVDFVLAFPQADISVDVFMDIPLRIGVDGNRG